MIYKLQLSNKESISITEQEYEKFKNNVNSNFIEFKEGLVNPSFVVSITIDYEATAQEQKYITTQETIEMVSAPIQLTVEEVKQFRPDFVREILDK